MNKSVLSEQIKIVPLIKPVSLSVAAHASSVVEWRKFTKAMLLLELGAGAAGSTVDVLVQHADTSGGALSTLFTATQILQANDETTYYLDIDLLNPNVKPFGKITVTVGTDVIVGAVHLLLGGALKEPVTQPSGIDDLAGTWATGIIPSAWS